MKVVDHTAYLSIRISIWESSIMCRLFKSTRPKWTMVVKGEDGDVWLACGAVFMMTDNVLAV